MKLLFLSHHWTNNSHHSLHSGFQRLVHFAAEQHEVTLITWGKRASEYRDGAVRVITVKGGRRDFLFQKRRAISRKGAQLAAGFDAIHALYEDCSPLLPKGQFIVTFHVLPGVVQYSEAGQRIFLLLKSRLIQRKTLHNAASIACVSTNLLAAIPPPYRSKSRFIPHGIDTDFWDPALARAPASFPKGDYVLCVGAHGLDRQLLTEFVRANPGRIFVVVGLRARLDPYPNVRYLYNVSDEELRDLYAGAALLIRPLHFATANNSILEALSMGTTILASRIPGVTDYLTDHTCVFIDTLPGRSLHDWHQRQLDPAAIRRTAIESFSWRKILSDYSDLYRQQLTHA